MNNSYVTIKLLDHISNIKYIIKEYNVHKCTHTACSSSSELIWWETVLREPSEWDMRLSCSSCCCIKCVCWFKAELTNSLLGESGWFSSLVYFVLPCVCDLPGEQLSAFKSHRYINIYLTYL